MYCKNFLTILILACFLQACGIADQLTNVVDKFAAKLDSQMPSLKEEQKIYVKNLFEEDFEYFANPQMQKEYCNLEITNRIKKLINDDISDDEFKKVYRPRVIIATALSKHDVVFNALNVCKNGKQ